MPGLSRPKYTMPDFVLKALIDHGLVDRFNNRSAYQQNDYIGWITRARHPEIQMKRLD